MASLTSPRAELEALLKVINDTAQAAILEYEKLGNAPSPLATQPHTQDLQEVPNLSLIKATRLLEGACDQLCAALSPPAHTLVQRSQIYYWSALKLSQEAQIASLLKDKPDGCSIEELSIKTGINQDYLTRILRTLASRSHYIEIAPGIFAHSRLSASLLNPYVSDLVALNTLHLSLPAMDLHHYLTLSKLRTPKDPQDCAWFLHLGTDWYSYIHSDESRRQLFGRAMIGMGLATGMLASIHYFPWKAVKTVGDIGSGIGGIGSQLVQWHPHLNVVLHDLPGVMNDARMHWTQSTPEYVDSGRLCFSDYDALKGPPTPGLDVYIYKNLLINFSDDNSVKILENCRAAMATHSRLLIQESIAYHPDPPKISQQDIAPKPMLPDFGKGSLVKYNIDLTMLALFNSKSRTLVEWETLSARAGLALVDYYDFGDSGLLVFGRS